jgi:hypothetical protein
MVREHISGKMDKHIKEIGKMVSLMDLECLLGQMVKCIKEPFCLARRMGKVNIIAQMDLYIMDNLRMIAIMEKECSNI